MHLMFDLFGRFIKRRLVDFGLGFGTPRYERLVDDIVAEWAVTGLVGVDGCRMNGGGWWRLGENTKKAPIGAFPDIVKAITCFHFRFAGRNTCFVPKGTGGECSSPAR